MAEEERIEKVEKALDALAESVKYLKEALRQSPDPISVKCMNVLKLPELPEEEMKKVCWDFVKQRQVAMCKAWQIMEEGAEKGEPVPFRTAISRAWIWLKKVCEPVGGF